MALHSWLSKRELGQGNSLARNGACSLKSSLCQDIYGSFRLLRSWDPQESISHQHHGGIFNFDFSPDGSVLVAACERQSLLMFDPHNARLRDCKEKAHSDCVNYVRFLDSRLFATCSDDKTVRLWDMRFLKTDVMTLRGHTNWVKNIEYARNQHLLLTSGFDGSICTWDINKNRLADSVICNRVFHARGLMRSRLSPSGDKLIVSTTEGQIIVIHDLDLANLLNDIQDFKPSFYSMLQTYCSNKYASIFKRGRNRVEMISDFPSKNSAEMIASLDVHPQGWCIVSRNTSRDENSEWTCVHDIQNSTNKMEAENPASNYGPKDEGLAEEEGEDEPVTIADEITDETLVARADDDDDDYDNDDDGETASNASGFSPPQIFVTEESVPFRVRIISIDDLSDISPTSGGSSSPAQVVSSQSPEPIEVAGDGSEFLLRADEPIRVVLHKSPREMQQQKAKMRLMHFIEEPNVGRGFIKEICFSNDGRVICSPFAHGVRVLAFDSRCSELCDCIPESPAQLHEVATITNLSGIVVTNKFSPTNTLLVTGSLDGQIGFHQPVW